jgi:hypothetical protein
LDKIYSDINENTQFRPELQDKIDSEQKKITSQNDEVLVEFDDDGQAKIKSSRSGLNAGNVSITWEADQKCVKPKVTVNELATKDEIITAVQNAEDAFVACMDSLETLGALCAPLPVPEPKNKKSMKDMRDLDE